MKNMPSVGASGGDAQTLPLLSITPERSQKRAYGSMDLSTSLRRRSQSALEKYFESVPFQLILSIVIICLIFIFLVTHYVIQYHEQFYANIYMQVGAIITTVCTLFIIYAYGFTATCTKYPNVLLFFKSITDFIFAVRFLVIYDTHTTPHSCVFLAGFSQFFALSSECWFLAMSLDLWFCTTNPFTNIKSNLKMYHAFAWGMGGVTGLILMYFANQERAPISSSDYCWFDETDVPLAWLLYYGIVIVFVMCAMVVLFLENRLHLASSGMKESLLRRGNAIHSARIMTLAYCGYQCIVIALWVIDVYLNKKESSTASAMVENFLDLFHGSKGLIDMTLWIALNGFPNIKALTCRCLSKSGAEQSSRDDDHIDFQTELNVQLRREVLYFTTRGIVAASTYALKLRQRRLVVRLRIHEFNMVVRFNDYEPKCFREIRRGFRINEKMYEKAFSRTCHERIQSGGSSGAFMFYTADYMFLVKSITLDERKVLLRMLPEYTRHLKSNPGSHLTRFYGCHSIYMYGQSFSFVVMSNVIGKLSMHEFYDIKGSWVNRNAKVIPPGKKLICTYCSRPFKSGSNENCEFSILGHHMPRIVLKDNDLRKKLRLRPETAQKLSQDIASDCQFLCSQGIMDYSLLLSFHSRKHELDDLLHGQIPLQPSKRRISKPVKDRRAESTNREVIISDDEVHLVAIQDEDDERDDDNKDVDNNNNNNNDDDHENDDVEALTSPYDVDDDDDDDERGGMGSRRQHRFSVVTRPPGDADTPKFTTQRGDASASAAAALAAGTTTPGSDKLRRPLLFPHHYYPDAVDAVHRLPWLGDERAPNKEGYRACAVVGPDYYTLGIIDILQTWTWKKKLERFWKVVVCWNDARGVSAVPPQEYAERFQHRVEGIALASHPSDIIGLYHQ